MYEVRDEVSVPQPRFHVDGKKSYSVSILNNYFSSVEELFITTENFSGLDGEFWSGFCLSVLAWIPCEFNWRAIYHTRKFYWTRWRILIFASFSQKLFTNNKNGNTTAPKLTALPIHLWCRALCAQQKIRDHRELNSFFTHHAQSRVTCNSWFIRVFQDFRVACGKPVLISDCLLCHTEQEDNFTRLSVIHKWEEAVVVMIFTILFIW